MSDEIKYRKYSELSKEEKIVARIVAEKYLVKGLFNSLNCAGLIFLTSFIYTMANDLYFKSQGILLGLTVITDVYLINSAWKTSKQNRESFHVEIKKIFQAK